MLITIHKESKLNLLIHDKILVRNSIEEPLNTLLDYKVEEPLMSKNPSDPMTVSCK